MSLVPAADGANLPSPHIVVIGGGITGLTAAWHLSRPTLARDPAGRRLRPRVTLLEDSDRFGGKIQTTPFAGLDLDTGPDAFLGRVPHAMRLVTELGLRDQLTSPAQQRSWLWSGSQLHPFPSRTFLGVPASLASLAQSRVLGPLAIARAAADIVLPRFVRARGEDPTVDDVVSRRLGAQVTNRLVDPLIGGINGGNVANLSLASAAPQLAEAFGRHHSLFAAAREQLRRRPSERRSPKPIFFAPTGGMGTIVDTLVEQLRSANVWLRPNAGAVDLYRTSKDQWVVSVNNAEPILADAVLITTPAFTAAKLLTEVAPEASNLLHDILRYASVAMVRLAYNRRDVPGRLEGSGFVVPAVDGKLVTACSWASSKWKHLHRPETVVLRASVGRLFDQRHAEMTDSEIIDAVHRELVSAMGIHAKPQEADVTRWNDSFPQYEPGHAQRIAALEHTLTGVPGLDLAGAAYRGLGIPACIRDARDAAEAMLTDLGNRLART